MIEEKLTETDYSGKESLSETGEQAENTVPDLSKFMITGRELLSKRNSEQSRKESERQQDLSHQRLFFYSIEIFSPDRTGPIAEFSYLTADEDLNELPGRSGRFLMAIPPDQLPNPICTAASGISPAEAQRFGLRENEFAEKILSVLPLGVFCRIGWNNVGSTDERIRSLLFRTFHDPYLPEKMTAGNSKFDLLTFTRTVLTLRPGVIALPKGSNTQSLSALARANGIENTFKPRMMLGLMKLFKEKLPKMLSFYMSLRTKASMTEYLRRQSMKKILLVTAASPKGELTAIPAMPLGPIRSSGPDSGRWLMLSLAGRPSEYILNPSLLNDGIPSEIKVDSPDRADSKESGNGQDKYTGPALPKSFGLEKFGLFLLSPNRCPAVAPITTINEERAKSLGISAEEAQENYSLCRKDWESTLSVIRLIVRKVLAEKNLELKDRYTALPPEERLYEEFIPRQDLETERTLHRLEKTSPAEVRNISFSDDRLNGMLFRYIGRNLPEAMSEEELAEWKRLCEEKITEQMPEFRQKYAEALERFSGNEKAMAILSEFDISE